MASSRSTFEDNQSITNALQQKLKAIEQKSGLEAAQTAILEFLRDEPDSYQAFLALARLLMKQKKYDEALRAAEKAKSLSPMESDPHVALGFVLLRMKNIDAAAAAFADAIRLTPNSARAHLGAAIVKVFEDDYDDAMVLCELALDLDPSLERAYELIARIQTRKGRVDLAIEELNRLVAKNPSNVRAVKAYLQLMRAEGRDQEAITALKDVLERHEQGDRFTAADRKVMNMVSLAAVKSGRPEVAVEQYRRVMDAGSKLVLDQAVFASALIENGELDEAERQIEEISTRPAFLPVALTLYGDLALKSGDPDEAVDCYRKACKAANGDGLPPESAAGAKTLDETARLWMAHTRKVILAEIRRRRRGGAD